jgi:START domain
MSNCCCFCLLKSSKNSQVDDEAAIKRTTSDHYQVSIPNQSKNSSKLSVSSKIETETHTENKTDSSSFPIINEQKILENYINLYLPSQDDLRPCSELVLAQSYKFEMLLELEASTEWKVNVDKPFACIMTRTGTSENPNVPLMKAFLDLEIDAEPEDVYDVMYNPDTRKKWDTGIVAYNEISRLADDVIQYYMLNKAPWPFKSRDFVETRYIRRRINDDMEIYFTGSANEEYPEHKEKAVRGRTMIGGQIFRKRISPINGKPTLMVTTICQADMKGNVPSKILEITLPDSILKWYRSIKKQVQIKKESKQ